jgi:hypothetical protein
MKLLLKAFFICFIFSSCNTKETLINQLQCKVKEFKNLEEVVDYQNNFALQIPKNWKTNLYKDDIQSSIYTADTTKQLTETILIDISLVKKNIYFNERFLLNEEQQNLKNQLIKTTHQKLEFKEKTALLSTYVGKKGKFKYQKNLLHMKLNDQQFILAKIEIYGDSLVNYRFCNAINLIETIEIK